MPDDAIVWPVGTTDQDPDLQDRPFVFAPRGFLVAIVDDVDGAEQAAAALRAIGFADRELRTFTPEQISSRTTRATSSTRACPAAPSRHSPTTRRPSTSTTGTPETGRFALWVRVVDDDATNRAIRGLADVDTLHIPHYGHRSQTDFHLRRPTS